MAQSADSTLRYQTVREPRTELRLRLREIAQVRVRFGYSKILGLLKREGWKVGKKLALRNTADDARAEKDHFAEGSSESAFL
jgi:putative transposase